MVLFRNYSSQLFGWLGEHVPTKLSFSFYKEGLLFGYSVYDTKSFINVLERAFKVLTNGVYFIVIAFLFAE